MVIYGNSIQEGTPTPTNPIPIDTGIIAIVNGEKKIIKFDEVVLKQGDYITKKKDGKWYLVRGDRI